MIFHTRAAPRDPGYCLLSIACRTLAASSGASRPRRDEHAPSLRTTSESSKPLSWGRLRHNAQGVLARPGAALSSGSASPPPPCPGNSGARRGARHGEEAPWRREGPAEKVHDAEKGQPPLVECEVVHVQPPRAKRRRVAAPSPQPSPAPPTDSLAPSPRRHRGEHGPCAPGAAPSPRRRRSLRLLLPSSSRGR